MWEKGGITYALHRSIQRTYHVYVHFAPGGYVMCNHGSFVEHYHGIEDIPPEHRVFAYPQLNIREQMAAYQEVIDRSALNEGKQRLSTSREDR